VLPLTCSAACDIRARLHTGVTATATLAGAGHTVLRLGGEGESVVPGRRAGTVHVRVASGPPGATTVQVQTVSFRLRRPRVPPLPRVLGVTAVGHGTVASMTWRTDRSSRGFAFRVSFSPTASFQSGSGGEVSGGARRAFATTQEGTRGARYARLEIVFDGLVQRRTTVRVSGGGERA
jgi:hypothetical protein